jgi:hypothetical protein
MLPQLEILSKIFNKNAVKEKAKVLLVASKEIRPEVNGDKHKYIIMP